MEASLHLNQPLMSQRIGHQYQDALRALSMNLLGEYQACLDGFPKTDFIGKKHPRSEAVPDACRDVNLMREECCSCSQQASQSKTCTGRLML